MKILSSIKTVNITSRKRKKRRTLFLKGINQRNFRLRR
nr:MAG TPA: hypothetical protein [Caudoviricetes sp.]